jgi:hypothetical protein
MIPAITSEIGRVSRSPVSAEGSSITVMTVFFRDILFFQDKALSGQCRKWEPAWLCRAGYFSEKYLVADTRCAHLR